MLNPMLLVILVIICFNVFTVRGILPQSSPSPSLLTEWSVPTPASGPWALTLDSGVCCWFLEYYSNKLAHLNPVNNTFQEWEIPTANAYPYSLTTTVISGSQAVWGTEFGSDKIFVFFPTSGTFREYSLSQYNSGTNGVSYISAEPSGAQVRVWFTESLRNANGEFIYDPTTGNVTFYEDHFPIAAGGGAYGVYAGSNSVWFAGFSSLIRWDRASSLYSVWQLPTHGSAIGRAITLDEYGQAWYTQGSGDASGDNYVGVLRGNSTIQEWHIPAPNSDPGGIAIDPLTQQPWVAEQSPSVGNGTVANLQDFSGGTLVSSPLTTAASGGTPTVLGSIQTQANVTTQVVTPMTSPIIGSLDGPFSEFALGSAQPHDAVVDSSGNVWISEPASNKIARLTRASDFAIRTSPPALSLSQGSYSVASVDGISISNYAGKESLTVASVPSGVTVSSFSQNPLEIQAGGTATTQFTINVASNAPNVTGTIVIEGSDGVTVHRASLLLTVTNSSSVPTPTPSQCFIATATYGSELSPEVQLLRNFRDNSLAKSKVGSSFLIVFNAWYYSFSPTVATYISTHEIVRTGMRVVLYPLIGFMFLASRLYRELSAYPELAALLSGLLACSLIGAFYVGLPLGFLARRRLKKWTVNMRCLVAPLLLSISAIAICLVLSWTELLMISSSMLVLSTLLISGLLTAKSISHILSTQVAARVKHQNQERSF